MYRPEFYREDDLVTLHALMRDYSFATLQQRVAVILQQSVDPVSQDVGTLMQQRQATRKGRR